MLRALWPFPVRRRLGRPRRRRPGPAMFCHDRGSLSRRPGRRLPVRRSRRRGTCPEMPERPPPPARGPHRFRVDRRRRHRAGSSGRTDPDPDLHGPADLRRGHDRAASVRLDSAAGPGQRPGFLWP